MFFVISKILTIFIRPLFWSIALVIWALIAKKPGRKKILSITALALLFLCSNKVFVNEMALLLEPKPGTEKEVQPRLAVVLGGFAEYDRERNRVQMSQAAERLFEAAKLYKQKQIDTILISGGAVAFFKEARPESEYAREYLIALGVDSQHILIETRSKNTYENALFSKEELAKTRHHGPILLITSAWHMARASRTFTKAGIAVVAHPVNFLSNPGRGYILSDYLLPSSEALYQFDMIVKEWMGFLVYKVSGKS